MPLPRSLTYNDLTGEEVKHILIQRFTALLNDVPYLQKHLTLPRVRMYLTVTLECWADQKHPETQQIVDQVDLINQSLPMPDTVPDVLGLNIVVDASPRGDPPDKVREQHGLGVPTPTRGPVAIEDQIEGKRYLRPNGQVIDRTGSSEKAQSNATVVEQDFGPMRNGRPEVDRDKKGQVEPPDFRRFR